MNVFPGGTTRLAWASFPSRNSNSVLVQAFRPAHVPIRCWSSSNIPAGNQITKEAESSSNLRRVIWHQGPSNVSEATGRPSRSKTQSKVVRALEHSDEAGPPTSKKSFKQWMTNWTPSYLIIHSTALAMAVKILGADLSPKGRAVSIYRSPSHSMPISHQSSGWMGMWRYALFTSTLARRAPWLLATTS